MLVLPVFLALLFAADFAISAVWPKWLAPLALLPLGKNAVVRGSPREASYRQDTRTGIDLARVATKWSLPRSELDPRGRRIVFWLPLRGRSSVLGVGTLALDETPDGLRIRGRYYAAGSASMSVLALSLCGLFLPGAPPSEWLVSATVFAVIVALVMARPRHHLRSVMCDVVAELERRA